MLHLRIMTAVVLLSVLVPTLCWTPPYGFNLLALFLIAAGVWEWARLHAVSPRLAIGCAVVTSAFGFTLLHTGLVQIVRPTLWAFILGFWIFVLIFVLRGGVAGYRRASLVIPFLVGALLIAIAWLAVAQLREKGINTLLSSLSLVWAADVCAYAAGRMVGGKIFAGRKLASAISPQKTWEGVFGGFFGVLCVAGVWLWMDQHYAFDSPSLYALLWQSGGAFSFFALLLMTALAVAGDLLESLVKRYAGVKDSSQLLPGHGGVLDRVDALLPVLPAAMFFVSLA